MSQLKPTDVARVRATDGADLAAGVSTGLLAALNRRKWKFKYLFARDY